MAGELIWGLTYNTIDSDSRAQNSSTFWPWALEFETSGLRWRGQGRRLGCNGGGPLTPMLLLWSWTPGSFCLGGWGGNYDGVLDRGRKSLGVALLSKSKVKPGRKERQGGQKRSCHTSGPS
jgi:hypothetical protein